jgi:hypothetical protein
MGATFKYFTRILVWICQFSMNALLDKEGKSEKGIVYNKQASCDVRNFH